jgi:hypothetical protein
LKEQIWKYADEVISFNVKNKRANEVKLSNNNENIDEDVT